jgi:transposase
MPSHTMPQLIPTGLPVSERQWARVAPLLAQAVPAAPQGRALVSALLYQAVTGRPWAELVAEDPRWLRVQAVCQQWQELGLLDALSQALLVRLGRD